MGWLEKLGLVRKKARPVGQSLEKDREQKGESATRHWVVKGSIFAVLVFITLAAFPSGEFYDYTVRVGDQWRQETLEAPFDFAIYKHPDTLQAEREAVRQRTPPYFREASNAQRKMQTNRDTVARQFDRLYETYRSYQFNKRRGNQQAAEEDSLRFKEMRRYVRPKLTPEQWRLLKRSYRDRIPGGAGTTRTPPSGPRLDERMLEAAWSIGTQLQNVGVLDTPLDSVRTEEIIIRNETERTERSEQKEYVYGLNEVYEYAREEFRKRFENNPEYVNLANAFFRAIFQPSLQYMRGATMENWEQRSERISPTRGKVEEGEVIVRKGQIVTRSIKRQLASLERAKEQRGIENLFWKRKLGQLLLTLAAFLIFFLYLFLLRREIFEDNSKIFLISLLFAGIIGFYALAIRLPTVAMYAVPVAIASLILTVMFDSRMGLFGTLTLAVIGGQLVGYDFEFFFATLFAGTLGSFSIRDIKTRGRVFVSALPVFFGYLAVLSATWLFMGTPLDQYQMDLLMTGINSLLVIMGVYPLLWVFERVFGLTTDLTLLELSDTNRPLLKELSIRAPGTFNHSLQVANLAEAAADAIGANALQTRVGALYHDIGKMLKPEYFVENQQPGRNPHNQLKPRMSSLIIASHVKEGLEMGRQYNLPRRVLDFIPTHHGTSRIEFFYQKALEQADPDDPEVLESEFRYPGPRPYNKETGILMLADSVEAASRSLSNPTHKRLKNLIDAIFEARIEDNQLDQTDLTFQDLDTIKKNFLSLLTGTYHVRVQYPGQDEEEGEEESLEDASERRAQSHAEEEGVIGIPEQSVASEVQQRAGDNEEGEPSAAEEEPRSEPIDNGAPSDPGDSSPDREADAEDTSEVGESEKRDAS